jgi:carbamoyltransferase
MYFLGLSTMGNSAACLFKNNKLLYAIEEERLSRIKNDSSFPKLAIKKILKEEGISITDINIVYVYWQPWRLFTRFIAVTKKLFYPSQLKNILIKSFSTFFYNNKNQKQNGSSWIDLFFLKKFINKNFGNWNGKIKYVDHHLSHILYSASINNFKNSLILSYDGGGEEFSTVLAVNKNYRLANIKKIRWPNSLGHYYSFFTGFLGFQMLEGEYKMMGLAPYGKPRYEKIILEKILKILPDGNYEFNHNLCSYHNALENNFDKEFIKIFGKPRLNNNIITKKHMDIASSVQSVFEKVQLHMLIWAKKQYPKINNLVIAGGCGLNVSANGFILRKKLFKKISIPPAPHDAGCSIGSVLYRFYSLGNFALNFSKIKNISNPYLGFRYTDKDVLEIINKKKFSIPKKIKNKKLFYYFLSKSLARGKIIAWFQGKDEFGPRALGARSFLADPRNVKIKNSINLKIKQREKFRPFAPSILNTKVNAYFDINQKSPYMNIVANVIRNKMASIPSVVHRGTSRVHSVSKALNKKYYNLLNFFFLQTKVPILLNTSFNIQEPIVSSPLDAINTFMKSKVDYLVIEDYVFDSKWRNKNMKLHDL